jgi:hypothetical protein
LQGIAGAGGCKVWVKSGHLARPQIAPGLESNLKRKEPVGFTRSRPYHKNDNAHVEQKNWTVLRQLFGYQRFDNPALVRSMNALYANEYREHLNFFCPSFKLKNKERLGSKLRKTYEIPQTPYQRLMQSARVSKALGTGGEVRLANLVGAIRKYGKRC